MKMKQLLLAIYTLHIGIRLYLPEVVILKRILQDKEIGFRFIKDCSL